MKRSQIHNPINSNQLPRVINFHNKNSKFVRSTASNQFFRNKKKPSNNNHNNENNILSLRATNSTLIFFSRLVNLLNQKSQFKLHVSNFNDRPSKFQKIRFKRSYTFTKPHLNALTMTKQPQIMDHKKIINSHLLHNNKLSLNTYHIIDSCGLFSIDGISGSYLCSNSMNQSISSLPFSNSNYVPALDHLIPQCNPTCGFISNPQRIKLVDVLALYEVNTEVLAGLLGMSTTQLKDMGSEEQMRVLFCKNNKIKKDLGQFILPQLSLF